jgi:hypothetical protein
MVEAVKGHRVSGQFPEVTTAKDLVMQLEAKHAVFDE